MRTRPSQQPSARVPLPSEVNAREVARAASSYASEDSQTRDVLCVRLTSEYLPSALRFDIYASDRTSATRSLILTFNALDRNHTELEAAGILLRERQARDGVPRNRPCVDCEHIEDGARNGVEYNL